MEKGGFGFFFLLTEFYFRQDGYQKKYFVTEIRVHKIRKKKE